MPIIAGFAFALLLIVAFLGWGRFIAQRVLGGVAGDWPYQAAWGICVVALLGGILNVFGWVSVPANLAIIATGAVLAFAACDRRGLFSNVAMIGKLPIATRLALAVFALAACGTIVISLFPVVWDTQDDSLAYAVFPVKMLQTGTLIEPFSHRRIIGYGGYPFLQSLVLTGRTHHELPLFDQGIATVLAAAAIAYYSRRRLAAPWGLALLGGIVFMLLPPVRINLSPVSVFSLLSLTLLETAQLTRTHGGLSLLRRALMLALVSAALVAMRANAIVVIGSLLLFLLFFDERASRLQEKATLLLVAGVISFGLLVPWAITLQRSSGTPFYPLIGGYYNRAIAMSSPIHPGEWLTSLWQSASYSGLGFLLIATALGLAVRALPKALACYTAATFATAFALFAILNLWGADVLDRYYSPFVRVAQILTLTAWCVHAVKVRKEWREREGTCQTAARPAWLANQRGMAFAAAAILAGGFLVAAAGMDWKRKRDWSKVGLERSLEGRVAWTYKSALTRAEGYRAALATIPKGARILAQVDAPFLLDFREHDISITDDFGVVSPPPGLPSSGDPEALTGYLSSLSIDYLLCVNPMAPLREGAAQAYYLDWWKRVEAQHVNNKLRAPWCLWFLNSVVQLAARHEKLYDSGELMVLSLKPRR